jgi:hypothetical protein
LYFPGKSLQDNPLYIKIISIMGHREKDNDISKLKPDEVFFLHQKNVNIIQKIKEDIIKDLSGFTGVSKNIK